MTIKIDRELRKIYAEKVLELANIGAGLLLFSQILSEKEFSWQAASGGLVILLGGFLASYFIYKRG
jgi:hypothetical protein